MGGFFGQAGREEEAKDARVVVTKVDLLAVGEFDGEEMSEVGAEIFEGLVAGDEDAPAFGPSLLDERVEESRFLRDADEIGSEVGELSALRARVKRLMFFFGFEDDFQDAGLAGGIEKGVERLEVFGQEILKTWLTRSGNWKLGSWFRRCNWRGHEFRRSGRERRQAAVQAVRWRGRGG